MSVESGIRDKVEGIQYVISRSAASFSTEVVVPYFLPALDALMILLSCLEGGIVYHVLFGDPFELLAPCASWRTCQPYLTSCA